MKLKSFCELQEIDIEGGDRINSWRIFFISYMFDSRLIFRYIKKNNKKKIFVYYGNK